MENTPLKWNPIIGVEPFGENSSKMPCLVIYGHVTLSKEFSHFSIYEKMCKSFISIAAMCHINQLFPNLLYKCESIFMPKCNIYMVEATSIFKTHDERQLFILTAISSSRSLPRQGRDHT